MSRIIIVCLSKHRCRTPWRTRDLSKGFQPRCPECGHDHTEVIPADESESDLGGGAGTRSRAASAIGAT